jgi:DnaJ-class molecular chaperone
MPRQRFDTDYYAVLGVAATASDDDIRKAYRRLALQWHPDRNAGDARAGERFKEISEAYGVLIDPQKRREYDAARRVGAPGDFRHSREDVFRDLFANPQASAIFEELARELSRMGMRVDSHYFRQTLFGGRAVVTGGVFVITPFTAAVMAGRLVRALIGHRPSDVRQPRSLDPSPLGLIARTVGRGIGGAVRALLGSSAGDGREARLDIIMPLPLSHAEAQQGGRRRVQVSDSDVLVTIPPGIREGTRLRLRGRGRAEPSGRRGDAYLVVEIHGH